MFAVKPYFIQTQVPDPKKSLGTVNRVFLPTLNHNEFNYIRTMGKNFYLYAVVYYTM